MRRISVVLLLSALAAAGLFGLGTAPSGGGQSSASAAPVTARDFYAVGYKASDAGKYDEAIGDFMSAIALKADYAEAYNMLGFCLRKTGKVQDAMQNYQKALALKPNFPEAREYYGEALLMASDLNGAVAQYIVLQKAGRREAKELLEKIADYLKDHPSAQS